MSTAIAAPGVNLSLLAVLVVEDTGFIRLLITSVLRALGIENIHHAENGGEAVKLLKERAKTLPEGTPPFDIIVSDLMMPEVDGFMLLRFIRTSPESTDRFASVAMMSGAADYGFVAKARDLGATEFIAKPFSTQGVWDRLMAIVYKPRRFVLGGGYFGPDRRRFNKVVAENRRVTKEADIQIVRTTTKKLKLDSADVLYFEFTNRLAAKVGGLPAGAEIPKIDVEVLRKVEEKIQEMSGDYSNWVADEIKSISEALGKLREPGANLRQLIGRINRGAHEMRGQGGIFGYPLITEFSKSLFLTTSKHYQTLSDNEFELLKAHIDAIKVVIAERVEGDGGETGRALLDGLQAAIKKYGKG
jgi:CheY-like chemotaxis protein